MLNVNANRNCVYQTAYHVVWCPKCRHAVLTGVVADSLRRETDAICTEREWPVLATEIQPDHVHLFLSIPPATAVAEAVKFLKGISAWRLFLAHPELPQRLRGSLWSPSYYVGTAGSVSAETIRRYIERTEHIKGRR